MPQLRVGIDLTWVATIDAFSAAIVGLSLAGTLSTTNATSAVVVATKDPPCN